MNLLKTKACTDAQHAAAPRTWKCTGLALLVPCGITLAFYHGLWLPGHVLIKRDAFRFFLPLKQYLVERLSAGELPQWFPYEALGRPFIGATHTGVFHPFTILYFFFSVHDAYRVSILLSCLLAAGGAFALGRTLNLSRAGALLAGIAFALSGYLVSMTDNLTYLYSICLLPFFCLALEKALTDARAWAVAPAIVWATVFLNGDVQTGYYYGFIALLWALTRAPGPRFETGLRLGLVAGLAALLAGIQLGPAWAVFLGSDRVHTALFHEQITGWSTHPLRLLTVLAAPVGEDVLSTVTEESNGAVPEIYIGYFWAESLYLGIPVTGLALLGIWQRPDLRILAWLAGLALLLSLGRWGGLYELFSHVVPFWSAFRYPEKFMGVASFAVTMLAGAGLDALRTGKGRLWPWLTAASLCLIAWMSLPTEAGARVASSLGASAALARALTETAARAALFSAVAALGVGMVIAGINRGTLRMEWMLTFLVAIVALDLSRVNLEAYHTGPTEIATFNAPLAQALEAREGALSPGRFRLVTLVETLVAFPEQLERTLGHYAAVIAARRQALVALHNAEFHIETAKPYLPGYNAELMAMLRQGIGLQAAARYNVVYYIGLRSRLKDPLLVRKVLAELPDYDLALFRNPFPAKPRVYLSRRPERAAEPINPALLLKRPDFLSGDVDVIETPQEVLPRSQSSGLATIERYAPEDFRVRVEVPQPAVLILLDAFDTGWTALLDQDTNLPIFRANALVRAVVVPSGAHVVTFRYETPLLRTGAAASLTGVLLCVGLIAHARWRIRHAHCRA
jgi:hypothetical protein